MSKLASTIILAAVCIGANAVAGADYNIRTTAATGPNGRGVCQNQANTGISTVFTLNSVAQVNLDLAIGSYTFGGTSADGWDAAFTPFAITAVQTSADGGAGNAGGDFTQEVAVDAGDATFNFPTAGTFYYGTYATGDFCMGGVISVYDPSSSSSTAENGDSSSSTAENGDSSSSTAENGDSSSSTAENGDSSSSTAENTDSSSSTAENTDSSSSTAENTDSSSSTAENTDSSSSSSENTSSSGSTAPNIESSSTANNNNSSSSTGEIISSTAENNNSTSSTGENNESSTAAENGSSSSGPNAAPSTASVSLLASFAAMGLAAVVSMVL